MSETLDAGIPVAHFAAVFPFSLRSRSRFAGLQAFTASPVQANIGGTDIVIKEVYGAGGNAGAVLNADFVELFNPAAGAKHLNGLTIQYRSAAGGVGGTQALPNVSIPSGGSYLIQMSAAGAVGAALPTPDLVASPPIGMAAAGGQTILGVGTTFGSGNLAGAAGITDMVGVTGATSSETSPTSAVATATQSLNRSAGGADTDSNSADFTTAAPTPTNSARRTRPARRHEPRQQDLHAEHGDHAVQHGRDRWHHAVHLVRPDQHAARRPRASTPPARSPARRPRIGVSNVTLRVTDNAAATNDVAFTITVNAPGALVADNPGAKSGTIGTPITSFTMAATGGTAPYTWSDPATRCRPGVTVSAAGWCPARRRRPTSAT